MSAARCFSRMPLCCLPACVPDLSQAALPCSALVAALQASRWAPPTLTSCSTLRRPRRWALCREPSKSTLVRRRAERACFAAAFAELDLQLPDACTWRSCGRPHLHPPPPSPPSLPAGSDVIHVLINNAGLADPHLPATAEAAAARWREVIDVNLTGEGGWRGRLADGLAGGGWLADSWSVGAALREGSSCQRPPAPCSACRRSIPHVAGGAAAHAARRERHRARVQHSRAPGG